MLITRSGMRLLFLRFSLLIALTVTSGNLFAQTPQIVGDDWACRHGVKQYTIGNYSPSRDYEWNVTGGSIQGSNDDQVVNILWTTGTSSGTVSLRVSTGVGGGGGGTTYKTISIADVVNPSINGPSAVCIGSSGNRYETQPGMHSYYWTLSSGAQVTAGGTQFSNFVEITWGASGSQSVAVRYEKYQCISPTVILPVTVNNVPVPPLEGISNVCQGNTGDYSTLSGKTQYEWIVPPGGTLTAGGGIGDNTITILWNSSGTHQVKVRYNDASCMSAWSTKDVTVNPLPVPTIVSGPASVCVGSTGNVYTTEPGQNNYQWAPPTGGTITAGGGLSDNSVTITWNSAGAHQVSVHYKNSSGCQSIVPGTRNVEVLTPPAVVSSVAGLKLNFQNEPSVQEVSGAADATRLTWSVVSGGSATFTEAGGSIPGRRITLITPSAGNYVFHVTPEKNGCAGTPFVVNYTSLSTILKNSAFTMQHPELLGLAEGYLFLSTHSPLYTGCVNQLGPVTIKVQLDLGDIYNLGENAFTSTVNATVTAFSDLPGVEQSWTVPFNLSQNGPEQLFIKTISTDLPLVRFIRVKINNYTNVTPAVQNAIRLKAWFEAEDKITLTGVSVTLNPFQASAQAQWEQSFSWQSSCTAVPDYIFQLLKIRDEGAVAAQAVDWNNALNIHTESSSTSLTLSMAEGTGDYRWRVIPLGNQTGGIANPANWGTPSAEQSFSYDHPEKGKNWIYSRTFTEGNRVSEQVTYANGLQQIAQQQTRIQGENQIVASQTFQDFVGRNAVSSLPIPAVGKDKLGYVPELIVKKVGSGTPPPYNTADFDTDPRNPSQATDFGGYYSNNAGNPISHGVADARGYPFTQTIFTPDGTGRVREQTGVGYTHSVKGGKTVRTFYSHPSEPELVRLFGKETPDIRSVQKITTFDPNGSASISYQTKDGKVIATALAITGAGPLLGLSSASSAKVGFSEEIKGNERINDYTVVSRKPLFAETDRFVKVDYEISPGIVQEMCASSGSNGLVGYYPLDGNTKDMSSNANHATISGGVTVGNDSQGMPAAYDFNGTTGYLTVNDAADLDFGTNDFTVAFWVKKGAATASWDNSAGVGKWDQGGASPGLNEWSVSLASTASNNLPSFSIESGTVTYSVTGTTSLGVGQWYHLAAVRSGTQMKIFVNGVQQGVTNIPANAGINNVGRPVWVGRITTYYTLGSFDDIQIYRRGLSSAEIAQVLSRGTVCKTCDYKIDIVLFKEGDNVPTTIASTDIVSKQCADQASVKWDPAASAPIKILAGVNYVLEKRITLGTVNLLTSNTYIDENAALVEDYYRTQLNSNARLAEINTLLEQGKMVELYSYLSGLGYTPDSDNQIVFPILPAGTPGCQEFLYIPYIEPCPPDDVLDPATCKMNGKTFEQYFESYYTGHATITALGADGKLSYVFFKNLYTNTNLPFARNEFDAMVSAMMTENQLSCATVWEAWKNEVQGYEAKLGTTFEGSAEAADYSFASAENDMFRSFLSGIEAKLQEQLEVDQPGGTDDARDICVNRPGFSNPYFIKKTQLYGHFRQTSGGTSADVIPDLLHAYQLAYFNDNLADHSHNQALKFYRGTSVYTKEQVEDPLIIPAQEDFNALSVCDKYKFSNNTQIGNTGVSESEIEELILKMRTNCGKACESRAGEFRQAIIRSLFAQNPNTVIEHYNVYLDEYADGNIDAAAIYVGVYDATINSADFTVKECELESLVEGLIQNCKNSYCSTPLTPHDEIHPDKPGYSVRVYGTQAERERMAFPLTHNFEITLNPGQSCGSGWDLVPGVGSTGWSSATTLFGMESWDSGFNALLKMTDDALYFKMGLTALAANYRNIFVAKSGQTAVEIDVSKNLNVIPGFDKNGNLLFLKKFTFEPDNGSPAMPADFYSGNTIPFVIGGIISGTGNFMIREDYNTIRAKYQSYANVFGRLDSQTGNLVKLKDNPNSSLRYEERAYPTAFDSFGNSYVIGKITLGYPDYGIVKIDANGNQVWISDSFDLYVGGAGGSSLPGVVVDENGQAYVYMSSGPVNDIRINGTVVQTLSATNIYAIIKFDANGHYLWHKAFENVSLTNIKNPALIPAGNSVIVVPPPFKFHEYYDRPNILPGDQMGVIKINESGAITGVNKITLPSVFTGDNGALPVDDADEDFRMAFTSSSAQNIYIVTINKTNLTARDITQMGGYTNPNITINNFKKTGNEIEFIGLQLGAGNFGEFTLNKVRSDINNTIFYAKASFQNCPRRALCFRFTDPKELSISIPPEMEDYVFDPQPESCSEYAATAVRASIEQQKEQIIASRGQNYRDQYLSACGDPSRIQDKLLLKDTTGVHHFTLYYYDRAGNLIRTVPPQGVALLLVNTDANLASSKNAFPSHTMVTEYQYNTLGQLVHEHSPDANYDPNFASEYTKPIAASTEAQLKASKYYSTYTYNDKGQLRFSRNAKQKRDGTFSYTKYDELGRVVEVGESPGFDEATIMAKRNEIGRGGFPVTGITQVTSSYYTDLFAGTLPAGYTQRHLRNRVSYAVLDEDGNTSTVTDQVTTVYSYDPHGNVEWLAQLIPGLPPVAMKYDYDLISGKVLQVKYNPGQPDEFYHKYEYDANNRISAVFTSKDYILWEREAKYDYYKHGPLKRSVIGEDLVQGIDYTYTLHGWLKGLNHQYLDITNDPMKDASTTEVSAGVRNHLTGRDAFGMALQYYTGDYRRNGSPLDSANTSTLLPIAGKDLYNGNISTWASNGAGWASAAKYPTMSITNKGVTGYKYTYDQLNRLRNADLFVGVAYTSTVNYNAAYTYFANGNIATTVARASGGNQNMDNLAYAYYTGTNRLDSIRDSWAVTPTDLDVETQKPKNYKYDPIGNLTSDTQQGTTISWTPYGKVKQVLKTGGYTTDFMYDASGNRVMKKRTTPAGISTVSYYVRDASGNIMGVYERIDQGSTIGETALIELPIYGSDRLGVYNKAVPISTTGTPLESGEMRVSANSTENIYENVGYLVSQGATLTLGQGFNFASGVVNGTPNTFTVRVDGSAVAVQSLVYTRTFNNRQYELKDHLGNVRTVVADVKLSTIVSNAPQNFEPRLLAVSNYNPFGMDQPDRMWSVAGKYRYGFNGKEKDSNGEWGRSAYDYGFRIYDPSIGRFLSVDPLTTSYPMLTPYQFGSNSPIASIDLDGQESWFFLKGMEKLVLGTTHLQKVENGAVKRISETVTGTIEGAEAAINLVHFFAESYPQKLATGGDYSDTQYLIEVTRVLMSETAQSVIADYKNLVTQAAKGDEEAIGALGVELAMLVLEFDEFKHLKGLKGAGKKIETAMLEEVASTKGATNLNLNSSTGNFVIYQIEIDETLHKFGKADLGRITKKTGLPTRLHQQLRKLRELYPNSIVRGKVIEDLGTVTTKEAKSVESNYLQEYFDKTGSVPKGNEKSFKPKKQ